MLYRNDFANKKVFEAPQHMPSISASAAAPVAAANLPGCGGMPPMTTDYAPSGGVQRAPVSQGVQQTHSGIMPDTQLFPSSLPMIPATGAVTASSATSPLAPAFQGQMAAQSGIPLNEQVPSTLQNAYFTPGFLRTQIGRRIRVEFLLGNNLLTDRTGTLVAVGASYIVLRLVDSDDLMMCDIFSIKFATILL